jgi:von Willebrand factor type A domain
MRFIKFIVSAFLLLGLASIASANEPSEGVDVVIMLDQSGSISSDLNNPARINDLDLEKRVAKQLLDFFRDSALKPRVAVGTFNNIDDFDPTQAARIIPGGELTANYDSLVPVIDSISRSQGWTDVAAALYVGVSHVLSDPFSKAKKFVIIVSDGIPNRPGLGNYEDCSVCGCDNSYEAAEVIAEQARRYGVEIITIQYDGNGSDRKCSGEPEKGINFMRDELAFLPQHSYLGSLQLAQAFDRVACQISCDDGNPCTFDSCDDISGQCTNVLVTEDKDGDTIPDCSDSCFGNNALIGTECTKSIGSCSVTGTFQCGELGAITCESVETAAAALSCSTCLAGSSQLNSLLAVNQNSSLEFANAARDIVQKNLRKLRTLARNSTEIRRITRRINRNSNAFYNQSLKFLQGVGQRNAGSISAQSGPQCAQGSNLSCVTPFNNVDTGLASLNLERLLKSAQRSTRIVRINGLNNGRLASRVRSLRANLPKVRTELVANANVCS